MNYSAANNGVSKETPNMDAAAGEKLNMSRGQRLRVNLMEK
jgi:hypothetical protein